MASNNSDSNTGLAVAFAVVCMGIYFIGLAILAGLVVLTVVTTILSLIAMFAPLKLGKITITPSEARWFLFRGVLCFFLVPFVVLALSPVFNYGIRGEWIIYIALGGYMLGSVGVGWFLSMFEDDEPAIIYPPATPPAPVQLPHPPQKPFEFATWDDEEMRR